MRTNYIDVASQYDHDAYADYPVFGADWREAGTLP